MYLVHRKLQHVADFASDDSSRPSLQHVQITNSGDAMRIRATDGCRVITITDTSPQNSNDYPVIPGLDADANGYAAYLPAGVFAKACRIIPKKPRAPILEYLAVSAGEKATIVASMDLAAPVVQTVNQPEDQTFPDLDSIVPKGKPVLTIGFDPELLGDTLISLAKMLDNTAHGMCVLEFYDPLSPVRITAGEEIKFEILVAPKRTS